MRRGVPPLHLAGRGSALGRAHVRRSWRSSAAACACQRARAPPSRDEPPSRSRFERQAQLGETHRAHRPRRRLDAVPRSATRARSPAASASSSIGQAVARRVEEHEGVLAHLVRIAAEGLDSAAMSSMPGSDRRRSGAARPAAGTGGRVTMRAPLRAWARASSLAITSNSRFGEIGLVTNSSMPAARQRAWSSRPALAVIAITTRRAGAGRRGSCGWPRSRP
jgi:hypothetical protein